MNPSDRNAQTAYRDMLRVARRVTSSEGDARDLVQDAILISLERGLEDWWSPGQGPWLRGILRKRAAFLARTSERRRRREQLPEMDVAESTSWAWRAGFLSVLPSSLRVLARLVSLDLSGAEIRWLLDLSPTAFRARLSALSKRVRGENEPRVQMPKPQSVPWEGPFRVPVLAQLKKLPHRALATHDPDGHVLFFRFSPHRSGSDGN